MKMDEHARAWVHEFVAGLLNAASLHPAQRSSLHWEIINHVHEAAQRRVEARAGEYITLADVQAVVQALGGREGLAAMFLEQRVANTPRATFGQRLGAFVVDALVIGLGLAALNMMFSWILWPLESLVMWGAGGFPLIHVGLAFGYFAFAEFRYGTTIGKMAFKLRTVMADGRPVTIEAALIRNVAKVVPPLLVLDVLLYLVAFKDQKQRASDRLANTVVIDTEKATWTPPAPPPVNAPAPPAATAPPLPGTPPSDPLDGPRLSGWRRVAP